VKTAPHLGHLIFASFATLAHPKENTANTANNIKMLTHFLITLHLLSSSFRKLQGENRIPKTDIKNPFLCQAKKINFFPPLGNPSAYFFFFGLAFFVAFFALGFFIPHDFVPHAIGSSPPFPFMLLI
jgi:hypothetical protein